MLLHIAWCVLFELLCSTGFCADFDAAASFVIQVFKGPVQVFGAALTDTTFL